MLAAIVAGAVLPAPRSQQGCSLGALAVWEATGAPGRLCLGESRSDRLAVAVPAAKTDFLLVASVHDGMRSDVFRFGNPDTSGDPLADSLLLSWFTTWRFNADSAAAATYYAERLQQLSRIPGAVTHRCTEGIFVAAAERCARVAGADGPAQRIWHQLELQRTPQGPAAGEARSTWAVAEKASVQ
jgi:hypothetical protein